MNSKIIFVFTHLAVAGLGVYAGWKLCMHELYESFNDELQEINDEWSQKCKEANDDADLAVDTANSYVAEIEYFRSKYGDEYKPDVNDESATDDEELTKSKKTYSTIANGYGSNAAKSVEQRLAESESPVEDDPDDQARMDEAASKRRNREEAAGKITGPYIISSEKFNIEKPTYDKVPLVWCLGDNTIYDDETEKPIDNRDEILGSKNLDIFLNDGSSQTYYIRNDAYAIDYEISKVSGTYKELVLGEYEKE